MHKLLISWELFWWSHLGKRILDWGMAMAWLWGRIPFIAGNLILAFGGLWIWCVGSLENPHAGIGIIAVALGAYSTSFVLGLAGGVAGMVSGYYAPANEIPHPFKSPFFRQFGRRAFAMWTYLALLTTPCFIGSGQMRLVLQSVPISLGILAGLLALSLRYALAIAHRHSERISLD